MLKFFDRLNLTPSERRLVVIVAAVAVVVLNYWLVWPRFRDFGDLADEIESMRAKKRIYEAEIARAPAYREILQKLQAQGSILPSGEEQILFRSEMERLARDVGLHVPRWGEVLPERGGGTNAFFESISLTMNQVAGTEAQFVEFLYRVGASNSTIRVKELTLAPGAYDHRAGGRTNLVGTIKLVASVQKEGAVIPPPTTSAGGNDTGATASVVQPPARGQAGAGTAGGATNRIPAPSRAPARTNATMGPRS